MRKLEGRPVLVTGGSGFLGSALVRALVASGARVRSLDNESRGSRSRLAGVAADVELVTGDIRDAEVVARAVEGVDAVYHLAYVNGTEFFYEKPDLVLDVAVKGMMNVLDACIRHEVRDLVLASSSEVYQHPPRIPTDEAVPLVVPDPLNPRYSYGGGKLICELLAINYGRKHFDRVTIFRPHNVYGPDMGWEHVIPQLVRRAKAAAERTDGPVEFPIQGTGEETRSFIYIDDFTDGLMRVIREGSHLEIYHIGTQDEVSIAELAREIGRAIGRELVIVPGPLQPGSVARRCPDISKLRGLGFAPSVSLREGLAPTVEWYTTHQP